MKRGTAVLAFAATAMTLGLVVWLARAQTPGESGFVIPGTIAHHPVVTVSRGETLLAYGINKSPAGPALDVAIQFLDSNGIELIRQMCTAPAGGFCSVSFTGS